MCGIVGGISFTGEFFPDKTELRVAASYLKHRGPDANGQLLLDDDHISVAFAHTRLSIIDLSPAAHQPMQSRSGKSIITYNGEIYNFRELKDELEASGLSFSTSSDTEVILNGYECWGIEGTLQKLDGMFAFALWDKTKSALYLGRDRFGKKPLYYHVAGKRMFFSSDIRSFREVKGINLTVDMHSLGYFFSELSTPREDTIWQEIKKVLPASFMKFDESGMSSCQTYWKLNYTKDCRLSRQDLLAKTESLFTQAVNKRLVADVRVSALLSGGIDSSLVVAKMVELGMGKLKTYAVGFTDDTFNELPFARQVAEKFGTDHTEIIVEPLNLENVDSLIMEYGEPFADSSMIPTYLISREIAKTEKVVLGGDGGDELFGGYYSHYFARNYDLVKRFGCVYPLAKLVSHIYPSYRTKLLERLLRQTKLPHYTLLNRNMAFSDYELKQLVENDTFENSLNNEHKSIWDNLTPHSSSDYINVLSASLKTRLLNDYLVKIDRASMFASLEIRTPFLDRDLAEFSATLTPRQLTLKTGTKSILKEISESYFTPEFLRRKKMGFQIPLCELFRGKKSFRLKNLVLGGKQHLVDLNYSFIEKVIDEHINGGADHTHKLWALYVFHVWSGNQ